MASSPPRSPDKTLAPGTSVKIKGLQSKPELNGKMAVVLGPEHSADAADGYSKGRIPIRLADFSKTMSLKPECLAPATLAGEGYEDLCAIAEMDFSSGRKRLAIENLQKAVALKPAVFDAHMMLGQILESSQDDDDIPGAGDLGARHFLAAMDACSPESASPNYTQWTNAFVRAANLLFGLPSASKPSWWNPHGLKERLGLVLANPEGHLPDGHLFSPAWKLCGHAFEMENNDLEAAKGVRAAKRAHASTHHPPPTSLAHRSPPSTPSLYSVSYSGWVRDG